MKDYRKLPYKCYFFRCVQDIFWIESCSFICHKFREAPNIWWECLRQVDRNRVILLARHHLHKIYACNIDYSLVNATNFLLKTCFYSKAVYSILSDWLYLQCPELLCKFILKWSLLFICILVNILGLIFLCLQQERVLFIIEWFSPSIYGKF